VSGRRGRRRFAFAILVAAVGTLAALVAPVATGAAYLDGPPPAHTGGFGEPTCHTCHFDGPLNDAAGALTLAGLPGAYRPGARYEISLILARPGIERGGLQLAVRFAEGDPAGRQAGYLEAEGPRTEVVELDGIQYLRHTRPGSQLVAPDTARWMLTWVAPQKDPAPVEFHVAANAANDDASEFGDRIYVGAWKARPDRP
jgi:hypothetical protein